MPDCRYRLYLPVHIKGNWSKLPIKMNIGDIQGDLRDELFGGNTRYLKIGKTAVSIVKGNLIHQQVDVIVNSTTANLKLNQGGPSSRSILKAAGNQIQRECNARYQSNINVGDVAVTGPGCLDCSNIFHVLLPRWNNFGDEEKVVQTVYACLEETDILGLESIAFPALGTGGLNYKPEDVANALFEAVDTYNIDNPGTQIELVICVVFKDDMYQKFLTEARNRAKLKENENMKLAKKKSASVKLGTSRVNVRVGNLTDVRADVIVYTCPQNLQLNATKGLPTAILNSAGLNMQNELDRNYPNGIQMEQFAVTNGYHLKCKKVYHGCVGSFTYNNNRKRPEQILFQLVLDCLIEASKYDCNSIAFPALGTGLLKFPLDIAASAVITAIKDFHTNNPLTSIKKISIVIHGGNSDWSRIDKAYRHELGDGRGTQIRTPMGMMTPSRGTKAYFGFKYREDPRPPTNWSAFTSDKTLKEWISKGNIFQTMKPDSPTYRSLENLFMKTIGLKGAHVLSIVRNENLTLYEKYVQDCQRIYSRALVQGPCKPLANTPGSSGPAVSMQYVSKQSANLLDSDINEVYLFHGTKRDRVSVLLQNGFDQRLSAMNFATLRLGCGVYTAEKARLSAHYTEREGECFLFVLRVCLGDVFTTKQNMNDLKRPPCKAMCTGTCVNHTEFFDSVVGEFTHRELVIYDGAKCYPEYLIKYKVDRAPQANN